MAIYWHVGPQICILAVWTCILDVRAYILRVCTCILVFELVCLVSGLVCWVLDLSFGCLDLFWAVWKASQYGLYTLAHTPLLDQGIQQQNKLTWGPTWGLRNHQMLPKEVRRGSRWAHTEAAGATGYRNYLNTLPTLFVLV